MYSGIAASDGDRVALQSMRFATPHSAGATCMTVGQLSTVSGNGSGNGTGLPKLADSADDQVHTSLQMLHMHHRLKHYILFNLM